MATTLNPIVHDLARSIAFRLSKRWNVDRDDITQEILLWCLSQGIDGSFAGLEDEEEYISQLRQARASMNWAGERYCRKEKAAREGYSPDDEAFYGIRHLEELLVIYYQVGIEEHAPIGTSDSVRHQKGDGAEYGNYLASVLDVQEGLEKVPYHYRQRLEVRYGPLCHLSDDGVAGLSQSEVRDLVGWHHDRLTEVLGSTGDQVRHRVETALKALQRTLGGPSPYRGPEVAKVA